MLTELYCMPSLRGVGKFNGPSLYDVISYSQPTTDKACVIFTAQDGYRSQLSLNEIKKHTLTQHDYLLAVGMKGYPLPTEHGFPLRLAVDSLPRVFQ